MTSTHVRLLGLCFKKGRMGGPQVPRHAVSAHAAFHNYEEDASGDRGLAPLPIQVGPRPKPISEPACGRSTSNWEALSAPPDNFKHSLTLFLKSISSFRRGTCLQLVSRPYLALDVIYRSLGAAFSNNPTRQQRLVVRQGPRTMGLSTSLVPFSRVLGPGSPQRTLL